MDAVLYSVLGLSGAWGSMGSGPSISGPHRKAA
jgi:hypothetical protein